MTQSDLLALNTSLLNLSGDTVYVPPKQMVLQAASAKGLEISGTFARRSGQMTMELTIVNRSLQPLTDFAIQFNKNTYIFVSSFNNSGLVLFPPDLSRCPRR